MTDAEYRKQKRRVKTAYEKWHEPTGLGEWIGSHIWHRDGTAGDDTDDKREVIGRVEVQWQYITLGFHWNLEKIAGLSDDELDRVIRHEIAHVLVNEMRMLGPSMHRDDQARDEAVKHEERVVTKLASVLLWCRMEGSKDSKHKPKKGTK
jgi:hypothetical protein